MFMTPLILKFGGASLKDPDHIKKAAEIVAHFFETKTPLVIVTSAMGSSTDDLIHLAQQIHPHPSEREMDMLISSGERISMALLAIALKKYSIPAKSFTGSQSGIMTSPKHMGAEIIALQPNRIVDSLNKGWVSIVAGFQGVSTSGEITTLGRGGSDTSAVALAIALRASKVLFFKNAPGILPPSGSPPPYRTTSHKFLLKALPLTENKPLAKRALLLAEKNNITLHLKPIWDPDAPGTIISNNKPRTAPIYETSTPFAAATSYPIMLQNLNAAIDLCCSSAHCPHPPFIHIIQQEPSLFFLIIVPSTPLLQTILNEHLQIHPLLHNSKVYACSHAHFHFVQDPTKTCSLYQIQLCLPHPLTSEDIHSLKLNIYNSLSERYASSPLNIA